MQVNKKEVGRRISELRKRKNLTMEQLADYVGASGKSTVSTWEKGLTLPRPEFLHKLATFFEVDLNFLKFGTLQNYVNGLIFNDLDSENSFLASVVDEFLKVSTDFLSFANGVPITSKPIDYSKYYAAGKEQFLATAISENYSEIAKFLGDSLKYGNDTEILHKLGHWFQCAANRDSMSFMGGVRIIRNGLEEFTPATGGFDNRTVEEIKEDAKKHKDPIISKWSDEEILDSIYQSKLLKFQYETLDKLSSLQHEYLTALNKIKKSKHGDGKDEED